MHKENFAVIIPTKDRPAELGRLLKSISGQDVKPRQIIVVDGSVDPVKAVTDAYKGLKVEYLRLVPASLTAQRNAGIRALDKDITLAAFLDDDIILEDGSVGNMIRFWEHAPGDVAGAAFNNILEEYKVPGVFEKFFIVNGENPGRVLKSGFQSRPYPVNGDTRVEWLPGYAMVFKRDVLKDYLFDERYSGYARYEDVDISYRIGKRYKLYVVADAGVRHLTGPEGLDFSCPLGRMEVVNRLYFVRKNPELSSLCCYWALIGILINNALRGVFFGDRRRLLRAKGNLAGLFARAT